MKFGIGRSLSTRWSMFLLIAAISALHILNYLNYSTVAGTINVPAIRALMLSSIFSIVLFTRFGSIFRYHLKYNYDLYAFVFLVFISSLYSEQPNQTLLYSVWLLISIYLVSELSSQIFTFHEIRFTIYAVIIPVVIISGAINIVFGAEIQVTGRVFGGLGTRHIDAALCLDAVLAFLAIRSVSLERFRLFTRSGALITGVLAYSVYIAIFGLTRSVWLGLSFGVLMFSVSSARNMKNAIRNLVLVLAVLVAASAALDIDVAVPTAVEDRVELTIDRFEFGVADARILKIEKGYELAKQKPFLGYGYNSGRSSHNSYLNLLIDTGYMGIAVLIFGFYRSATIVLRAGSKCTMFFLIGSGALAIHAFFESQITPGQANFVPMLMWFALTRSRYVIDMKMKRLAMRMENTRPNQFNASLSQSI